MIKSMVTSAVGAGVAAWLLAVVLHFAFVQKYILLGEEYETGAAVHFQGVTPGDAPAHSHDGTAPAEGSDAAAGAVGHDETAETSNLTRDLWTSVFFGLVYVAYALILVAGFGIARAFGREVTARDGLIWGVAGFAAFQLAPAMGLAPELPGTIAADLGARQVWWWGTALATAGGLALLGYGRGPVAVVAAFVLLALPHVIGAPELEGFSGVAPPEVAAAFSARVLGAALAVWALMGFVAGWLWSRPAAT